MKKLRKRLVVGLTVIAALALSGVALAADGDDTVLNYGYDPENHFFIWNVTSLEYSPDDEMLEDTLEAYQEEQLEAVLAACGLEGDDPDNPDGHTYTYDPVTGLITVTAEGESEGGETEGEEIVCGEFSGGDVTGPAGQVNHGMFLKFFNENYEGEGRGCIVSQIARSGLGKGDQQVRTDGGSDDGASSEPSEGDTEVVEGSITFTTVTTDCQRGNGKDDEAEEEESVESEAGGPPQHVLDKFGGQHPKDAKGKPANTPGGRP